MNSQQSELEVSGSVERLHFCDACGVPLYLEALGIAADQQENKFFEAWLTAVGANWNTPAGHEIVWRARAAKAPALLVKLITDNATSPSDREHYLRALDFITGPEKEAALVEIATAALK